jgi:hypothetical protein
MIVTLNLVTGVLITILAIGFAHLIFRVADIKRDSLLFRILRYTAGEIAILLGFMQVTQIQIIGLLFGFMAIAGVTTLFCYLFFDRIDDRPQLIARAETAEDTLDDQS